jgi:hypothetical protein
MSPSKFEDAERLANNPPGFLDSAGAGQCGLSFGIQVRQIPPPAGDQFKPRRGDLLILL